MKHNAATGKADFFLSTHNPFLVESASMTARNSSLQIRTPISVRYNDDVYDREEESERGQLSLRNSIEITYSLVPDHLNSHQMVTTSSQ